MTIRRTRTVFMTLGLVAAVTSAGLVASGAGASAPPRPEPTLARAPHVTSAPAASAPDCAYSASIPADRFKGIPTFPPVEAIKPYVAVMNTSQGVIKFAALTAKAPCTTFSFEFLAVHQYFDGTHCHRLTTQGIYVLQCGDPTGTGAGGPGYTFNDENLAGATYPAGTVAMANAGPNTNGSQFFITWKDSTLRPNYTPFGRVIAGMSVLQKIAAAGDDQQNGAGDGYPNLFVRFSAIKIVSSR